MSEYFSERVESGFHKGTEYAIGDRVKILSFGYNKGPCGEGVIVQMLHGNFGKGRIHAVVETASGKGRPLPLGRLKLIK